MYDPGARVAYEDSAEYRRWIQSSKPLPPETRWEDKVRYADPMYSPPIPPDPRDLARAALDQLPAWEFLAECSRLGNASWGLIALHSRRSDGVRVQWFIGSPVPVCVSVADPAGRRRPALDRLLGQRLSKLLGSPEYVSENQETWFRSSASEALLAELEKFLGSVWVPERDRLTGLLLDAQERPTSAGTW